MLNSTNNDPRVLDIPLSENTYKFLKILKVANNVFLEKITEDLLASYKEKLIKELNQIINSDSHSPVFDEEGNEIGSEKDKYIALKKYILSCKRYTIGELANV